MAEPGASIDVKQFLYDNKLSDVLNVFIERDISIEELMEFDVLDLKQFGIDVGLDILQCNRLVRATQKLCPKQSDNISTTDIFSSSPIIQVIVSEAEQKAISKFNKLYNKALLMNNNINASFNILEENAKKAKQHLYSTFEEMINNLELKRKELITGVGRIHNTKQSELYQQTNELQLHQKRINNTKIQYESLVSNPTLDLKVRKKKIKSLLTHLQEEENVNKYICYPYYLITEPNIKINKSQFKHLSDVLQENISISSCDFPSKPLVSVKKIHYNSSVIKWKTKQLSEYSEIPILRFEIQIKSVGINVDEKRDGIWKSEYVSGTKSSYKIINLEAGHVYNGRIRGENNNGYGRFSDTFSIKTKDMKLIWDESKHGNCVEFVKKNRVKCGANGTRNIVVSTYKIDKKNSDGCFGWEIECNVISNNSWIGFVRSPATTYITNWNYYLGAMNYVYSIGFGLNQKTATINCQSHSQGHNKTVTLPFNVRHNDKFKFYVNWKKRCVTVYQNNKEIKLQYKALFENINETCIVPAVSSNTGLGEYTIRYITD